MLIPSSSPGPTPPPLAASSTRNNKRRYSCYFRLPAEIGAEQREGEVIGASTVPIQKASFDQSAGQFGSTGRLGKASADRREIDGASFPRHGQEHFPLQRSRGLEPVIEERSVKFV